MGKIPGINHPQAIRALVRAGFRVIWLGRHIVMSDGQRLVTIPRHSPIQALTMGGIAKDAGLTVGRFRTLL